MWSAQVRTESGDVRSIQVAQIEGKHSVMEDVLAVTRDIMAHPEIPVPWHLLEKAAREGPTPWTDPIPAWAPMLGDFNEAGLSFRTSEVPGAQLAITWEANGIEAWHHPTLVVVPVPDDAEQLRIKYDWDRASPWPNFAWNWPDPYRELPPTLDGRLYMGSESTVLESDILPWSQEGPQQMLEDKMPGFSWLLGVKRRTGVFIGRLVRRFLRHQPEVRADPGFMARLTDEEARDKDTAEACPRIESPTSLRSTNPVVIVVHGTFSCAMATAALVRAVCPQLSILRFEHDTFLPIMDNVRTLAGHLRRLSGNEGRTLLLLAHSRGGLVACQAVATVLGQTGNIKAEIWTAGTPHHGTPLAGVGGIPARMMGALYRICARTTDRALRATFVEGAASYLVSTGELPPGIKVMREGSDFLDLHRFHAERLNLRTWGAHYSLAADGNVRHGLLLDPALAEVFDGQENDLVVPTESAILDKSMAISGCDHFCYFETDQLRDALRSLSST